MAASITHTYGPNCTLQPASNPFTRRASQVSNDAPNIRAHFFYSSDLPIDDPLSPVPPSISTGPSKVACNQRLPENGLLIRILLQVPPRPFSVYDNIALEQAWQALQKDQFKSDDRKDSIVVDTAMQQDVEVKTGTIGDPHLTLCDHPDHIPFDHAMPVGTDEIGNEEFESGMSRKRHRSPFRKREQKQSETIYGTSPSERDTTGTPFLRVSERLKRAGSRSSNGMRTTNQTDGADSLTEAVRILRFLISISCCSNLGKMSEP